MVVCPLPKLVFHGTQEANIEAICRDGLNPSRRGLHGQAHGAGEYFAETPTISMPYCQGGRKMIVFAVLMDQSGLTKRSGGVPPPSPSQWCDPSPSPC